jgi:hypothetical protein
MPERSVSASVGTRVVAEPVPRAVMLTAWWNCWAAGRAPADDFIDAMSVFGPHALVTAAGENATLLGGMSNLDNRMVGDHPFAVAVLPVAGDVDGLPGPRSFNEVAVEVGQCVLLPGVHVGLIPQIMDGLTNWQVHAIDDRQVSPLVRPETAAAAARLAILAATTELAEMEFARDRETVAEDLRALRSHIKAMRLPLSLPPGAAHTAHSAIQVLGIVTIAINHDDPFLSAADQRQRLASLGNLARTARQCLAAACSAR